MSGKSTGQDHRSHNLFITNIFSSLSFLRTSTEKEISDLSGYYFFLDRRRPECVQQNISLSEGRESTPSAVSAIKQLIFLLWIWFFCHFLFQAPLCSTDSCFSPFFDQVGVAWTRKPSCLIEAFVCGADPRRVVESVSWLPLRRQGSLKRPESCSVHGGEKGMCFGVLFFLGVTLAISRSIFLLSLKNTAIGYLYSTVRGKEGGRVEIECERGTAERSTPRAQRQLSFDSPPLLLRNKWMNQRCTSFYQQKGE